VPYYTLTICLNIVVTALICARLFKLGKAVSKALGHDSARMYTSVASMLIESAAPYSLVGFMFLVPYARGDGTAIAFGQVWAKLTVSSNAHFVARSMTDFKLVFGSSAHCPSSGYWTCMGQGSYHPRKQRNSYCQLERPFNWHRTTDSR